MVAAEHRESSRACTTARTALRRVLVAGLVLLVGAARSAADGGITERPLAPQPAASGRTMFTLLPPEQTGLRTENRYADPRMWGDLYQEFESGSLGTGVAVGDFDGDGRPDLFVVSKTESCRLFRNLGGWRFEDVTEKAGVADHGAAAGIWKSGVSFVDVNNDGLLDLYVCRFNAPNLLYINQGDGTFKEMAHAYGLDVTDASVMASFGDYDRDGWLDVYITTNLLNSAAHPGGQRGHLLHNNGRGSGSNGAAVTFTDVTDRAGIRGEAQSHSAIWWDYDNDGWPDLYVTNDFGVPDKLYHNNRDGTFTDPPDRVLTLPHTSFSSMGSDLGDVLNDGFTDLFVADMAATTHLKDQHAVADTRSRTPEPPDGSTVAPKYHRNALLINTGVGPCLEAAYLAGLAVTDWTWSVRFEDLDNDGRLDLFVTNGFPRDPGGDVLRRMMNADTPGERIRIIHDSPVLNETNLAFRNLGGLRFASVGPEWGLDHKGVSFGAAFGDFGGTGNLDVVYANYQDGVTFRRNDNHTGHRALFDLRGTVSNRFGIGAKVRLESAGGLQTRELWLARGYMSSSEPMVHFGLGTDTRIDRLTVTWPSGHVQTFANLPADRRFTLTEPSGPAGGPVPAGPSNGTTPATQFTEGAAAAGLALASREEPVDESYLQPLMPVRLNRRGPAVAIAESPSGEPTLVAVGGTTATRATVLAGAGDGRFSPAASALPGPAGAVNDGPLLLFDADGDGVADLLVTRGGNTLPAGSPEYQPQLYFGDGRGGFRPAPAGALPPLPFSVGAAAAADFDRDGRLDVFIGGRVLSGQYPYAPTSALLVNRGGRFEDATAAVAPGLREVGMVTSALWSDVEGDGWPDLLLTLEWGEVKCFHNNRGRSLEDWSARLGFSGAGTGWWTSIASADFNGDGRPDFVVGNVGLNTQYRADAAHPALLFSGDFKGDGSQQLIEAYYEGDKLYPWRSRRDLGAALPAVLKKFPGEDAYARATLEEILGTDKLGRADRFAATELRSGVFLSQPDGTYRFEPLPHLAQIAPLQGVVAGDFDGDGRADIYAVQNSYAPIREVGRFDGGLSQLLRGDGHGHFAVVPVRESGLIVRGDAKALGVLDLDGDGWPDFLVTRNNDTTLAFRNHPLAGRNSRRILLRGPAGNPNAIGARIAVQLTDGSVETGEIAAGSGYYSQSSAAWYVGFEDANPPKRIVIRWPGGATTEHPVPSDPATWIFASP